MSGSAPTSSFCYCDDSEESRSDEWDHMQQIATNLDERVRNLNLALSNM